MKENDQSEVKFYKNEKKTFVNLTESAKQYFIDYLEKKKTICGVLLSIKKTGCSGYGYDLSDLSSNSSENYAQKLNDKYQLFIDPSALPLINGLEIDYVKEGFQSKLVFRNPHETGKCGCGESFTVD